MRRAIVVVAVVLAGLGALAIRVVVEGRSALAEGDALMARGQAVEAIRAFETSARWYLPIAPHVDDAYDRLRALTAAKDPDIALMAWRSIRSAARVTRTLWQPHADDLAAADAAIARMSAVPPSTAGETVAAREAWHRSRLARDGRASTGAAALAALGVLAAFAGAIVLARRAITSEGAWLRRPALIGGALIVVGLVSWAAGLYNA